jgi:Ser/Thr protein kinase RdoA (MazF antagonist)
MTEPGSELQPYGELSPDTVLAAVESVGIPTTGSFLALNSYENRVYQVGTDDGFVVTKFYRPGRWSDAAILEEHAFSLELVEHEIPVVAPERLDGQTLHRYEDFRFAVFERRGGRWPELATREEREWMGRFLGRIHAVGAAGRFAERPDLSVDRLGFESVAYLLDSDWIPPHLIASYESTTRDLLERIDERFGDFERFAQLRIHGDCHPGNVLWTDDGPHFVDLDDCVNGPAVQDLWLFLSGSHQEMAVQLGDLLEGYARFRDFDYGELAAIEALRTLRILHYAAWIARRWTDPAFPRAFPWFAETRFWEDHVLALREQQASLDEPLAVS